MTADESRAYWDDATRALRERQAALRNAPADRSSGISRDQLLSRASSDSGVNEDVVAAVLDAVLRGIAQALKAGERVSIVGFGTFSVEEPATVAGRPRAPKGPSRIAVFAPDENLERTIASE